ncbi:hypothetical protein [Streptomyces sp. NPDC059701]|uniref:hypothetical protein n=1 Tax=Streptomyces sp. NPDC059701 TaxID=3346914 RepID=UPI0036A09796
MTRLLHLGRPRNTTGPGDGTESTTAAEGNADDAPGADAEHDSVDVESGSADAESGTDTDADAGPGGETAREEPSQARGGRRPRALVRRLAPAAGAALLVLAGSLFFYGAHQLRSTPSAGNHALTDAEATTRVAGDVGNALARIFSYTPDGLESTERAARSVLAGRAERQYTELMGRIRADLAEQRVTLSTQAVRTGVIELDGDNARLLVFLDQISHRGKGGTTSAAAQLTVTARWEKDQWRIVDIKTR